jgi:hypothetical protein
MFSLQKGDPQILGDCTPSCSTVLTVLKKFAIQVVQILYVSDP